MRITLALLVATLAFGLVPSTSGAPDLDRGFFVDGTDVFVAHYEHAGACNGPGTLTITIHKPGGDDVREVPVESAMVPDVCFPITCFECPPVPMPFTWTLTGAGVALTGGGSAIYDHYGYIEGAWSLQGPFQEGMLELHGVYG